MNNAQRALERATDISNEWRIHAFRELRAFDVPSGDVLVHGDLAGGYRPIRVAADREFSIWVLTR